MPVNNPSVLVTEYTAGRVSAYDLDDKGDPGGSRPPHVHLGFDRAEGATLDPVTNDFLFSSFKVTVPVATPDPGSMATLGGSLLALTFAFRRKRLVSGSIDLIKEAGLRVQTCYFKRIGV